MIDRGLTRWTLTTGTLWVWWGLRSVRSHVTGCGDGVEDDLDGLLAGGVVRDHLPLPVALVMEDRRAVIRRAELGDGDVVALGTKRGGKPLCL